MSYIPSKEADLLAFGLNMEAKTTVSPETYGLVAGDAAAIAAAVQNYASKLAVAVAPATRTAGAICAKNEAKVNLTAVLRGYAMLIKTNRAVENPAKVDLGLGVYDFAATPVPAPETRPTITVVHVDVRRHELRLTDTATPQRRAKPVGAIGMQFCCHVGDAAPADPQKSSFQTFVSRGEMTMAFGPDDCGKTAYYVGRWQTARGLVGPWSVVVSMPIAG